MAQLRAPTDVFAGPSRSRSTPIPRRRVRRWFRQRGAESPLTRLPSCSARGTEALVRRRSREDLSLVDRDQLPRRVAGGACRRARLVGAFVRDEAVGSEEADVDLPGLTLRVVVEVE